MKEIVVLYCKSIVLLRHAHAQSEINDKSRRLTDRGLLQAKDAAEKIKNIEFDLIITSSAKRTIDTAKIIEDELGANLTIVEIDELYLPLNEQDKQQVEILITSFPGGPLKAYLENDRNGAWKRYGKEAGAAIETTIKKYQAKKILIVGHGNIINSIGLQIDPKAKSLLTKYFDYCEGFEIKNNVISNKL